MLLNWTNFYKENYYANIMGKKLTSFLIGSAAMLLAAGCDNTNKQIIRNHALVQSKHIKKGDTLWKYATELKKENPKLENMYTGYVVAYLAKFNKIENSDKIKAGEKIFIPIYNNQ